MQTMSIKRKMSIAAIVLASFIGGVFMTTMGANLLGIGHLAGTESRAAFDGFDGSTYVDVANDLESAFISVSEVVKQTVVQFKDESETTRHAPGCPYCYPATGSTLEINY